MSKGAIHAQRERPITPRLAISPPDRWCGVTERRCACGRYFVARSGRHTWCSPNCPVRTRQAIGRAPTGSWPTRQCEREGCGRIFVPRAQHQRWCCDGCRYLARRRDEAALYGGDHKRLRRMLAPLVATGTVRCTWPGCGRLILPGEAWDLGHADGTSGVYAGPQHASCNRKTAGRTSTDSYRRTSRRW